MTLHYKNTVYFNRSVILLDWKLWLQLFLDVFYYLVYLFNFLHAQVGQTTIFIETVVELDNLVFAVA